MRGKRNFSVRMCRGLFMGLFLFLACPLVSQQQFKIPIVSEGIYRLSQDQASAWGLGNLNEISLYGEAGSLPQELDSSLFHSKEVPQKKIGDHLYFFLGQADRIRLENGKARLEAHPYTDTLYYLIRTGKAPENPVRSIPEEAVIPAQQTWNESLIQYQVYKSEEFNLLTSGRSWYGLRTFNNGTQTITFPLPETLPDGQVSIRARMMAQSFGDSRIQFSSRGEDLGELLIPSIPNSRYAVKGKEAVFESAVPLTETNENFSLRFTYTTSNPNGAGYLKDLLVGYPYAPTALPAGIFYNLSGNPTLISGNTHNVWDISDFHEVKELGTDQSIVTAAKKLAIFDPEQVPEIPKPIAITSDSGLPSGFPELIIVTAPSLLSQAERLARFKNAHGTTTEVLLTHTLYDSFGFGNPDITSIRNFLAFQWQVGKKLKHVLFFGKGSFDYKHKLGGRPNLVPTYSSRSSLDPLTTFGSDDYFGFLAMGKGQWEESNAGDHELDIGVGRIPAISPAEAAIAVDKIIQYSEAPAGAWKRKLLFIADDGDQNIHLRDAERHAAYLHKTHPEFELRKLYLDTFEKNPSEPTLPEAKSALEDHINAGLLLVNYVGHGNELTWAAEQIFTVPDIGDWPENRHYPIFVTATCEFGRHDSPFLRSGAEELLFAKNKGAIAVLSTGRPVFSSINYALNKAFIEAIFDKGGSLSLGDVFKKTKNESLSGALNRNFSLLGDPSLRLSIPQLEAMTTSLKNIQTGFETDTLSGLQRIQYQGEIQDPLTGALISGFDGTFEIRIENEPKTIETLGNESPATTFLDYHQPLFSGTGRVTEGQFEGELFLGNGGLQEEGITGKIKLFAMDNERSREAFGGSGIPLQFGNSDLPQDRSGPEIEVSLFDSLDTRQLIPTTQSPIWIFLSDESGIDLGNPEGITLKINENQPASLRDYYQARSGTYQQGYLKFLIEDLMEGRNTLEISASDPLGNTSTRTLEVRVEGSIRLTVDRVRSFPNPASDVVHFFISHNRPGENLLLNLRIFSLSGREIFSLERRFPKAERFLTDIQWIFLQSKTKYPAKGTYLYQIELFSEGDGTSGSKGGKIIIQ
ncbi:type IX secretion system sortase PorU [Cyclobacterium salsum]|uniref:type IX secretion system sortase PorU n=1 Tax=Cyclobacterium salsum TaxID=2666329 RepID=UPI001390A563|nr:type IX secretion system sortase PorU [Cyclobacterium salsum]